MKSNSQAVRAAFVALSAALADRPWPRRRRTSPSSTARPCPRRASTACCSRPRAPARRSRPELEAQAKDQVVLREIFTQEAEKQGIAASADYRAQMELARQSILIRELFEDFQKKNPVTDAEAKAEYDKFKAQAHRHRVPRPPHPGREGRRGQGADRADQGRRQVRGPGEEELQGPGLRRERRRPRLRQGRLLRARVRPGDGQAEEGRDDRRRR